MHPMIKRANTVQACMNEYGYKEVTPGTHDCLTLTACAMNGQGIDTSLISDWSGKTWADGYSYIKRKGFDDLVSLMDSALPDRRIAPAAALPGDIIALPAADERFGCSLAVALDNGRVLGLNAASGLIEPLQPRMFVCAWRL